MKVSGWVLFALAGAWCVLVEVFFVYASFCRTDPDIGPVCLENGFWAGCWKWFLGHINPLIIVYAIPAYGLFWLGCKCWDKHDEWKWKVKRVEER